MRKPAFCICENKEADQLRGNREADQRLCFRYTDSTIPLLSKSNISSFYPSSVAVQPGLYRTWSKTPKTGFLRTRLISSSYLPAGYYCETSALTVPTGPCDGGYFCTGDSFEAAPIAIYGGLCESGYFCPVGSTAMTPCTAGMYCATGGLSEPSGNCTAGYYCSGQATDPSPSDATGKLNL